MLSSPFSRSVLKNIFIRKFHISPVTKLKQIFIEKKDEKTMVVDAKYVDSPRKPYLIDFKSNSNKCPLCQLQLNLKHTDVLILSQYLNSRGEILPRKFTKLCFDQHNLVKNLIHMAQHAGLLPRPSTLELDKPYQKLNTYYDETTIVVRPYRHKHETRLYHLKLAPIEKMRIKPKTGLYLGKKIK